MVKLQDGVSELFACFEQAIQQPAYDIVVNQVSAMLGQLKITTVEGDWAVSAKGILSLKSKSQANLVMNDPRSILYATALELRVVEKTRNVTVKCDVPTKCVDYVKQVIRKEQPVTLVEQ
jgi:hypothetical protein